MPSTRLLVVRKTPIETINHTTSKIDHFRPFTANIHTRFARSSNVHQPDSVLRVKTSIWNLKMSVSREISAAEARKSAALPFLPDVGTRFEVTRQSPETVLTLIYASAAGQDGRILLYPQPQHFHAGPCN